MIRRLLNWRDWPLATKLGPILVLLVILPLVLVTLYNDQAMHRELLAATRAQNLQRAHSTAAILDAYLKENLDDLDLVAMTPDIVQFLHVPQDQALQAKVNLTLHQAQQVQGFDAVYMTNAGGDVLAASDPRFLHRDYLTTPWQRNAMTGHTTVDEPRYDPEDGQVYIHFTAPIYAPSHVTSWTVQGAIIGRITLSPIDEIVKGDTSFAGQGSYGMLVDYLGIRISHPTRPQLRFQPLAPLPTDVLNAFIAEERFGPATGDLLRDTSSVQSVVAQARLLRYDPKADPYVQMDTVIGTIYAAIAPLDAKMTRWLYMAAIPEPNLLAALKAQTQHTLVFATGMGLLAVLVSILITRLVTRPIREVATTAQAIAAGDMAQRVGLRQGDELGQLVAAFNAMADTVAGKEAQLRVRAQDLEEAVQKVNIILNSIGDGVYTMNLEKRILSFNPAAERLTGWMAAEAIGRSCREVFQPQDADGRLRCEVLCSLAQVMGQGDQAQMGKCTILTKDGRRLAVAFTTTALKDANGRVIGAVHTLRDVTREEELGRLQSDFVSMVSHELRAPLTNLKAAAQIMGKSGDTYPPEVRTNLLRVMSQQCDRLADFVENILSISRLEAGKWDLAVETFSLRSLVDDAIVSFQPRATAHRFAVAFPHGPLWVRADERKVGMSLHNLLDNAVNYSPQGGEIRVEAIALPPGMVQVTVGDQGIGIPTAELEKVFERFYRLDNSDARRVYGSGLGLYVAKKLIEAQGGRIRAESRVGVGSKLIFTLPRARREHRNAARRL